MILCDTNVIIEFFKANTKTLKELENIKFNNIAVSAITVMELFFGALNKRELNKIKKNIYTLYVYHIDSSVSNISINLVEKYSKNYGLTIPDAIIVATAISHQIELFTYNLKDFQFIKDLNLYNLKI